MSKSILSINDLKTRSVGVGGPLSAIISGLTGYHKNFSYWVLFPLWGLILSIVILLCPVLLPYLLLSYLSNKYKKEIPDAVDKISSLELEKFNRDKAASAAADSATAAATSASSAATVTAEVAAAPAEAASASSTTSVNTDISTTSADASSVNLSQKTELNADNQLQDEIESNQDDSKISEAVKLESDDAAQEKSKGGFFKAKKDKAPLPELSAEQKEHKISKSVRDLDQKADSNMIDESEVSEEEQHSFMKLYLASIDVPFNLKHSLRLVFGVMIAYFIGLFLMVEVAGFFVNQATEAYMQAAMKNKVLQIATPEQLAFNDKVVMIYALAIGFMLLLHIILSAIVTVSLLGINRQNRMGLAWGAVLKNLPGFIVLFAICYAVFSVVERYYAHFRLIAVEAVVRGEAYFNLTIPFLVLRAYLIGAFFTAFLLVIFMSLGVIQAGVKNVKAKDADPGPRMLRL